MLSNVSARNGNSLRNKRLNWPVLLNGFINHTSTGKVVPTVTVLVALADALDVSLDYLAGRSDDPARRSSQPSVKGVDSMATWKDLSNFTWDEPQKWG